MDYPHHNVLAPEGKHVHGSEAVGKKQVTITITVEVDDDAAVVTTTPPNASESIQVMATPPDGPTVIIPPAEGEPGYEKAFAKELAYRQRLDAEERAAGIPPAWTPEQRARLALSLRRKMAEPEIREKISKGLIKYNTEKRHEPT